MRLKYLIDKYLYLVMLFICIVITIVCYYLNYSSVYTHLYYIPIILLGAKGGNKSIYLAVILGLIVVILGLISKDSWFLINNFLRAIIFVFTAWYVVKLRDKLEMTERISSMKDKIISENK